MKDKNLTGEQIQQILDMLLYSSLRPIVECSTLFNDEATYLLFLLTSSKKRKISSLERDAVVSKMSSFLTTDNGPKRFALLKASRIERHFLHAFAKMFLDRLAPYIKIYRKYERTGDIEKAQEYADKYGMCPHRLYIALRNGKMFLSYFYDFRNSVIGQYIKKTNKLAKAHTVHNPHLSFPDLVQSVVRSVITALDKYDSRKGALTSYINTWAKNAVTSTKEHEYGVAYTIPQTQRKKIVDKECLDVNFGVSLDHLVRHFSDDDGNSEYHQILSAHDEDIDEIFDKNSDTEMVRRVAKIVDPQGIGRLYLDIGEYMSPEDAAIVRKCG